MGTGSRKWRFSRPTFWVVTRPASSSTPEVLHDPEPGHPGQVRAQLPERLAIALEEPVEEHPPTGVGQRPEDRRHVVRHARDFM